MDIEKKAIEIFAKVDPDKNIEDLTVVELYRLIKLAVQRAKETN